jgi:tetratricopeptide (TPR) repeat protein
MSGMASTLRSAALLSLFAFTLSLSAQQDSPLVQGVNAFKAGNYAAGTEDFRAAVAADPGNTLPHLYLGTAYSYQVVPNSDAPGNVELGRKAIEQLQQVPSTHPGYLNALRQIASVQRNIKDYDAARETERTIIALAPGDAEAHYTLGVIDWTQAYRFATSALAAAGLQDDGNGDAHMPPAVCAKIRETNRAAVDEAIAELEKAVDLRPGYSDAMSYLNLTYRRHADFACTDPAARKADLTQADQWIQRSIAAHKAESMAHPASSPQ